MTHPAPLCDSVAHESHGDIAGDQTDGACQNAVMLNSQTHAQMTRQLLKIVGKCAFVAGRAAGRCQE